MDCTTGEHHEFDLFFAETQDNHTAQIGPGGLADFSNSAFDNVVADNSVNSGSSTVPNSSVFHKVPVCTRTAIWTLHGTKWVKRVHPGSPPLELLLPLPLPSPLLPLPSQDAPSKPSDFDVKRRRLLATPLATGYYPHGRPPDGGGDNMGT